MALPATVEQLIGVAPAWYRLGDSTEIDGVKVRPVLGDFSDRAPCDRPPAYIADTTAFIGTHTGFDRSEDRPAVRQAFPGKSIAELAGKHSGKVALLFNGPSLAQHDLFKITYPIIGMNRTHRGWPTYCGPQPDYLCLIDHVWFDVPAWASAITHPAIINGSSHKADIGYRVVRHPRMSPFSFDLARDGYVGPVPCSTGYLALQLAVYLGFTEIHCLGLDMQGGHFDGTKASMHYPSARAHLRRIAKTLSEERPEVKVYLCGSPDSAVDCFPHASFSTLTAQAEEAA